MAEGLIFQVQRWSIHDGSGIRSTIFFKGCPLRCAWCANPESQSPRIEKGYGRKIGLDDLLAELRRDEVFYRESGGGVTFSGGEPLSQAAFLRAALKACAARGYHTAIETSLFAPWAEVADIFEQLDQVFVDLKHLEPEAHRRYTGADNAPILENIRRLLAMHSDVTVRMPLVAGVNDAPGHIRAVGDFLTEGRPPAAFEFMPYHDLGLNKYGKLDLAPPAFSAPADEKTAELETILRNQGLTIISNH